MSYLVIVIQSPNESIAQLNPQVQKPTKVHEELQLLQNYLLDIQNGKPANMYVVTRDTDPAVGTSGSGSQSFTYNKP